MGEINKKEVIKNLLAKLEKGREEKERGNMPTLNLSNVSFIFKKEEIDKNIPENKIGNYALGYLKDGTFYVMYVGRSDSCLNTRLSNHKHLEHEKCTHFKYAFASSVKDAFEKECKNFHDFGGAKKLLNKIHPDSPDDEELECPVSDCEG